MNRKVIPFAGDSNFTKELKGLVHTLSQSNASVLLVGEKGTGKKLFAQHLHSDVSKDFSDFFEINCKSFHAEQILSVFNDIGKIELSGQRITLYVSFIDDLSGELQQLFLELIDNSLKRGVNLKIISSVEDSLKSKVNNGLFLPDLYYRLNAIVLNMLPLNHRKDDILPIAKMYFSNFKKKSGIRFEDFSDEAKQMMVSHLWVGNIDELINSIQRAFIVGIPPMITPDDLGLFHQYSFGIDYDDKNDRSLKSALHAFKKEYLTKLLKENGWNQTKTAKILGIQRTYVIRLMNELHIQKEKI